MPSSIDPSSAPAPGLDHLAGMLAGLAGATPAPLRRILRALPPQPPSFAAARALDRLLLPRLDAATRQAWRAGVVELELLDLGLRLSLRLGERGFAVGSGTPTVTIRGTTGAVWRLARGLDDADRLFFERELVMEGDTEFGVLVKNTLDAVGPLWEPKEPRQPATPRRRAAPVAAAGARA